MYRRLADIAEIRQGLAFRSKITNEPGGRVVVIQAKDLRDDGRIDPSEAARLSNVTFKTEQRLRVGDVLLQVRGVNFPAALVDKDLGEAVAAAPLYVIRARGNMFDPGFLVQLLANPFTQEQLRNRAAGTYVPQLSRAEVEGLEIPLPPIADQRRFVELASLIRRERDLVDRLSQLRFGALWTLMHQSDQREHEGDNTQDAQAKESVNTVAAR